MNEKFIGNPINETVDEPVKQLVMFILKGNTKSFSIFGVDMANVPHDDSFGHLALATIDNNKSIQLIGTFIEDREDKIGKMVFAADFNSMHKNIIEFKYKNWKNEIGARKVKPLKLWYGKTEYHPEEQWLLHAIDVDKNAPRDFALKDIIEVY